MCWHHNKYRVFCIRNISKMMQTSGKKHAEHCLTHVNKTACEIWSVFDQVHFWVKTLTPFFHRSLQLSDIPCLHFGKGNFISHIHVFLWENSQGEKWFMYNVILAAMAALNQLVTSVLRFEISSNMEHLKAWLRLNCKYLCAVIHYYR